MADHKLQLVISVVNKNLKQSMGQLKTGVTGFSKKAKLAMGEFNKTVKKSDRSVSAMSGKIKAMLGAFAGGMAVRSVVSTFTNFDDVMRQVGAVAGATGDDLALLRDTAKEMGATTRYSAAEAGEGLKFLAMAGFDAEKATDALPGVLQLAAAGSMDLGQAADITTNLLSAYGMETSELGRVNDVMVQAFTNSNSTLEELGEGFKYVGPIAKGMGVNFENLVGTLGTLHSAGIKGSMAGTTLRGVLDALYNPTADETKVMAELSERIGGAGLQIKDSEGKFVGFTNIVGQLEKAGMTSEEALRLFGLRAGPGMAALLEQGSGALAKMDEKLINSGGVSKKIAEDMESGLGGAMRAIKSAWEGLKISLGEGFGESLKLGIEDLKIHVAGLMGKIQELKDSGQLKIWGDNAIAAFKSVAGWITKVMGTLWEFRKALAIIAGLYVGGKLFTNIILGLKGLNAAFLVLSGKTIPVFIAGLISSLAPVAALNVAALSLTGTLGVLAGAVGVYIAAWKIGEIISASNMFGLLEASVGQYTQAAFALIETMIVKIKIAYLGLKQAWADLWGDTEASNALQQQIDQQNRYLNAIEKTTQAIMAENEAEKERLITFYQIDQKTGEVIGKTQELSSSIRALTEAEIKLSDQEKLRIALLKAQTKEAERKAATDKMMSNAARAAALSEEVLGMKIEKVQAIIEEGGAVEAVDSLAGSYNRLSSAADGAGDSMSEATKDSDRFQKSAETGGIRISQYSSSFDAARDNVDELGDALEIAGEKYNMWTQAGRTGMLMQYTYRRTIETLRETQREFAALSRYGESFADKLGESFDSAGSNVDELKKKVEELARRLESSGSGAWTQGFRFEFAKGGQVPEFANNGKFIRRRHGKLPGESKKDSVPVMARPGEWFIKNEAGRYWGRDIMTGINSPFSSAGRKIKQALASLQMFGSGGAVMPSSGMQIFGSGGAVVEQAGPEKTVQVNLNVAGQGGFTGAFGEEEAAGLVRALEAAQATAL